MDGLAARGPPKKLKEVARWLCEADGPIAEDELADFGLVWEGDDTQAQDCAVWPDNWQTVEVFDALSTQWQGGFGGISGLRYEALPVVMRLLGVAQADRRDVFEGIRILEQETLKSIKPKH